MDNVFIAILFVALTGFGVSDQMAIDVFDAVNQVRLAENVTALTWDNGLAMIAKKHSLDIIDYAEPSHRGTDGRDPSQRGIDAGYVLCGDPSAIKQYEKLQLSITNFQDHMNDYDILVQDYEQSANELDSLITQYKQMTLSIPSDKYYMLTDIQQEIKQKSTYLDLLYLKIQQTYDRLLDEYGGLYALYRIVNDSISQGLLYQGVGENIVLLENSNNVVFDAVQGWLESPGHKENMLLSAWQTTGIGIASDGNRIVITQNFC